MPWSSIRRAVSLSTPCCDATTSEGARGSMAAATERSHAGAHAHARARVLIMPCVRRRVKGSIILLCRACWLLLVLVLAPAPYQTRPGLGWERLSWLPNVPTEGQTPPMASLPRDAEAMLLATTSSDEAPTSNAAMSAVVALAVDESKGKRGRPPPHLAVSALDLVSQPARAPRRSRTTL